MRVREREGDSDESDRATRELRRENRSGSNRADRIAPTQPEGKFQSKLIVGYILVLEPKRTVEYLSTRPGIKFSSTLSSFEKPAPFTLTILIRE